VSDTAAVSKGTELTNPDVSVLAPENQSSSFGYTISAVIARSGTNSDKTKLVMTNGSLQAKIWDAGNQLVDYSLGTNETTYFEYTVTLTGNWATSGPNDASGLTDQAKHQLLADSGKKYQIVWSITGTNDEMARIDDEATFTDEYDSADTGASALKAQVNVSSFVVAEDNNGTANVNEYTGENVSIATIKLYVRADGSQETDGAANAHTGTFSWTVAATASIV